MSASYRKVWLTVALLITLAITIYVSKLEDDSSELVSVRDRTPKSPRLVIDGQKINIDSAESEAILVRNISDPKKDIFQANTNTSIQVNEQAPVANVEAVFEPKPKLALVEVVVPPPEAPPIPFKYLGKYNDQNGLVVFLSHNGKNLIVKSGDIIQQTYRVDEIKPPTLIMTYLPMEIIQTINIGEVN